MTTITIKRSSTASAIPLAGDLAVGELAVNLEDKRLFTKQSDGTVIELSTNPTDLDAATLRIDGVEITASATELNSLDGFTGSTAELNLLDGLTATTIELNTLDGITASTAELNKLDGYTGSTAELNILDGLTATTAELNYVDGVTSNIQTQLDSMVEKAGDTMTGDLSLGDNVKAKFGASNDLEIFHDGSKSIIKDSGTGNLFIRGDNLVMTDGDGTEFIRTATDSAVTIKHAGNTKLETTSTGVDVTGTVTADGLTVDGDGDFVTSDGAILKLENSTTAMTSGNTIGEIQFYANDGSSNGTGAKVNIKATTTSSAGTLTDLTFGTSDSASNTAIPRLNISAQGDVSFYEDTGTTAKFVWDASAESLILKGNDLDLNNGTALHRITNDNTNLLIRADYGNTNANSTIQFSLDGTERMRIDSSGRVGIGTASPSTKLMLEHSNDGAVGGTIRIKDRDSQQDANQLTGAIEFESQDASVPTGGVSTAIKAYSASNVGGSYLTISTTDVGTSTLDERMRIDSSGNVGIGEDNPSAKLDVGSAADPAINMSSSADGILRLTGASYSFAIANNDTGTYLYNNGSGRALVFGNNETERARIDSSGNLLVGTTTDQTGSSTGSGGTYIGGAGSYLGLSRANGVVQYSNRIGSDGDIAVFRKNGSTVGAITVNGTRIGFGGGATGLRMHDDITSVLPYNPTTGVNQFDTVSLGHAFTRFKDLYLSGGVYLGGTGSANKLVW